MKLVEMICPRCGAHLRVRAGSEEIHCDHCGTAFLMDDEVRHVQYDNAEDAGYQFEKGRQRAKKETERMEPRRSDTKQRKKKKKRRTWLWILGWLFIFPLPLTVILLRKKKMRPVLKYSILAVSWVFYLLFAFAANSADTTPSQEALHPASATTKPVASAASKETPTPVNDQLISLESPAIETTPEQSIAPIERGLDPVSTSTPVPHISVTAEAKELVIGQETSVRIDAPSDYGEITWQSDNASVLIVDRKGNVKAVGGGNATITATASNGAEGSIELTVDGKKRLMRLSTKPVRDNSDVNIGNEWSYEFKINDADVYWTREYIVSIGDTLRFYAKCTESDDKPDVGDAQGKRTISQQDFDEGFTAHLDVKVKENAGRNAGKVAKFTMQFIFKPI